MSTKTQQYAHQSLAACGFAVMNSQVAWRLRPDLWASAQDCGMDFTSKLSIPDTQRLSVKLLGLDTPVVVLTRSLDQLEQRIEWVTGFKWMTGFKAEAAAKKECKADLPPAISEQ